MNNYDYNEQENLNPEVMEETIEASNEVNLEPETSEYVNVGESIVDSNGKELKNNFGLKLALSIVEMLSCCCTGCFGILTLIAGVIACVFTCLANSSYKNGKYDEFKSQSKIATILLIVGGVLGVIALAISFIYGFVLGLSGAMSTPMYYY